MQARRNVVDRRLRIPGVLIGWVLGALLLAFFILPLVALVASVPFSRIAMAATDPGVATALSFTLLASAIALAATLITGVPLGYLLARRRPVGAPVLESIVTVPVVVPHLAAGMALLFLLSPTAPLGRWAIAAGFPVFDTIWGTVLVMVYVSAPYAVLSSEVAFRSVDERLLEAAGALGASPSQVWWSVTLPLATRGVVSGALLSWARSVSEIGGFLILSATVYPAGLYSGPVTSPISVYLYNVYLIGNIPGAASVAALLVLVAAGLFIGVRVAERRWGLVALPPVAGGR